MAGFQGTMQGGEGGGGPRNQEGCEEPLLTYLHCQELGGHIARV